MQKKPKALVFAHPYEGRTSYFLAGLSHYYELDIYYVTNKRFRFAWQTFYKWQYSKDARFIQCESLDTIISINKKYDAAFIFVEAVYEFFRWFEDQDGVVAFVQKIRSKFKDFFWLEVGEFQHFLIARSKFWDMCTAVLKGQVFKREYLYLQKDLSQISKFQGAVMLNYQQLVKDNLSFDVEKYYNKIIPFPFTPTITDLAKYNLPKIPRVYDWAANTRTWGNGALRFSVIEALERNLPRKYSHSIEYHNVKHAINLPGKKQPFDIYLSKPMGKYLFKLMYGKYFYAQPLYWHNLRFARCYLGLGYTFSSLRTADAWGAGAVLVNFSFKKCEYGITVEDGYNYVSIGERDDMTDDNLKFKTEFSKKITNVMEGILANPETQKRIIKNQLETYNEYFSTPQQFVKKIFISKINY